MRTRLYILLGFILLTFTTQIVNASNSNASIYGTIQKENCKMVYLYGYQKLSDIIDGKIILDSSALSITGAYRFEINIPRPTEFEIKDNNNKYITYGMYVSPGDSLEFNFEINDDIKTISIDGKGHTFNAYLMGFVDKFYLDSIMRETYRTSFKKLNTEEFTQFINKRKDNQLKFCKEYRNESDGFSDELFYIAVNEITFKWAIDKLQYLWKHTYMNKIEGDVEVNTDYYNFLAQIERIDTNLIWIPRYHRFILTKLNRDYFNYRNARLNTKDKTIVKKSKPQNLIKASLISNTLKGINKSLVYALLINAELERSSSKTPRILDSLWNLYEPLIIDTSLATYLQNKIALFKYNFYYAEPIDFSLIDINGDTVSLSDYRGKLVYLDFWSTYCAPCIKEIPLSNKLQQKLKDENVVFLNISFDQSQEKSKKLIESKKWEGIHLIANNTGNDKYLKSQFNFNSFPHYAIINEQGIIVQLNANSPSNNAYQKIFSLLEKGAPD